MEVPFSTSKHQETQHVHKQVNKPIATSQNPFETATKNTHIVSIEEAKIIRSQAAWPRPGPLVPAEDFVTELRAAQGTGQLNLSERALTSLPVLPRSS